MTKSIVALFALAVSVRADVGVRVMMGVGDPANTKWDGSAVVTGAQIKLSEPWRFEDDDSLSGASWKFATHEVRLLGGRGLFGANVELPIMANGVILTLSEAPDAEVAISTAQGNFTFRLRDIPFGTAIKRLNNRVIIDRIPAATQLTNSPEEQDYPTAVVDKNGVGWVAYLEFKHNPEHNQLRANVRSEITDFTKLKAATGGDQVWVRKVAGGEPIAITAAGGDLYRPAIAVDGTGRVWVFWSANEGGNFDLWARPVTNDRVGTVVRITREAGSDVFPAAATDSTGNVWVTWQGWRNGKAAIFAAKQNGSAFGAAQAVSNSPANEWNPSIAADGTGHVTVAWDSYRAGNYDVYMRTAANGAWGAETAAAASARYEAYPSIAYDPSGRLWIAYEEGGERWGKDFGAYDTTGYALYQGRAIRLIGFEKDGSRFTTRTDPGTVMPGVPAARVELDTRQANREGWQVPDPNLSKGRANNAAARNQQAPRNTSPRLHVDASGRIWIAHRSSHPIWWNPIGTVWTEFVESFDGATWTGPIFLAHSDNVLDNRPALISTKPGELTVIGSADGRRQFHIVQRAATATGIDPDVLDPFNNDLWANTIVLGPASVSPATVAAAAPAAPGPDAFRQAEVAATARMREARIGNLRIMRGEFHRHSEVSMDGSNDGSLLDQWRYAIDTGAMDWIGCCDHDNGGGREYTWWTEQKLTDMFHTPGKFVPMFSYERSVVYPEGHRNVIFTQRGVRTLPRLFPRSTEEPRVSSPDTKMLYAYLKFFNGICASHTSGTLMGTDWRDNDPLSEPVVEIYQGDRQTTRCRARRAPTPIRIRSADGVPKASSVWHSRWATSWDSRRARIIFRRT